MISKTVSFENKKSLGLGIAGKGTITVIKNDF